MPLLQVLKANMFYFCVMLTREEADFVVYWEKNRDQKRKVLYQLAMGLPLGLALVVAIFANFLSGWYKRASMIFRADSSMFIVLMIACLLIIVFITVFSVKHKWDLHETRYRELLARRDAENEKTGLAAKEPPELS